MNELIRKIRDAAVVEVEWPNGDRETVYASSSNFLIVEIEDYYDLGTVIEAVAAAKRLD